MKKYLKLAIVVITFAIIGTVTGQIESISYLIGQMIKSYNVDDFYKI